MAKGNVARCKSRTRCHKVKPYLLSSCSKKAVKKGDSKNKCTKAVEKKDWEGVTCSVCLESPHNAVLLLCSSYHKGCRPYMCATSCRFSNCLEQYKKAYMKVTSIERVQQWNSSADNSNMSFTGITGNEKMEVPELLCPLCRGQVKGWTVVEAARRYLNSKKRACMQEKCSFVGSYKELRNHVKAKHPLARPRAVDPALEEKWKKLECERERSDVISMIMSSTPGALVFGDYVIEPFHDIYEDEYDSEDSFGDDYFHLESFDRAQSSMHSHNRYRHYDLNDDSFAYHHIVPSSVSTPSFDPVLLARSSVAAPNFHPVLLARRRWMRRGGNSGQ
ncbi:uncharacterized protein LOC110815256 [Carica papaya]|uniref:uncharacterized protein LOC110815256 n=1 Tax=Carica papaya TaxID=3649 RepID=UPI000B8CCA99|nr:uncharacterized protein LOC110815256 [Carica papaya]XP_021898642.1 uncharacterized protein LOC110815256 [Carica papaya]